jgi:hypothetical protein
MLNVFNNPDASAWDKIVAVLTTASTIIPVVTSLAPILGLSFSSAGLAIGAAGTAATIPWLPFIGIIAAVVAGIAVLALVGKGLANAYNADAIAAENAANASRELAAAYNEAKSEYENLMATMDKYSSARDNLDNLTEGTKEYQAALNEANQAALDLIKSGNLVKGKDYTIEGGEIIINDDAMERMEEESYNKMLEAQASSTMANAVAAQA